MSVNGIGPAVLLPRQQAKLARGANDKEHAMSQTPNTAIAVIGIDIGKNSFHVVGHDARGAIVLRQKWSRGQVEARLANIPPCLIGKEACVGKASFRNFCFRTAVARTLSGEIRPSLFEAILWRGSDRLSVRAGTEADVGD